MADEAVERLANICNARGLHARAAAKFVRMASTFDAHVEVSRDDLTVVGTSILGLMMLAAGPGSTITIRARGAEAARAVEEIAALVERGFDE